ncbi:hypothetical protein GCM10028793_24100 [Nocardiopsis oceani]
MVAVSAARLKVVAIERFARQRRSTLTRFAATAGWRLSGTGDVWSGRRRALRARRTQRHKHGLAAVNGHSAGALTGPVSRPVNVCGEPLGLRPGAPPRRR